MTAEGKEEGRKEAKKAKANRTIQEKLGRATSGTNLVASQEIVRCTVKTRTTKLVAEMTRRIVLGIRETSLKAHSRRDVNHHQNKLIDLL